MAKIKVIYIVLLCIAVFSLAGCMEDESFTQTPADTLGFSADTIRFNTVYSGIGSRTEELTVYNPNDKGLRLASIRLASGGKSGFRMNVDGQFGTDFSDIEIFHEDSIFIFVEVTPGIMPADTLVGIMDSIVFTLPDGRMQQVILTADGQNVNILRGVTIKENTRFNSAIPYIIYDSLRIDSGVELAISPGVRLCFHKDAVMKVHGTVKAQGTLDKPVIFRGDRTDRLLPAIPYDNTTATWGGIHIYPDSQDNIFDFCDIHGGKSGITVDATTRENSLTLTNSIVNNIAGNCLELTYCDATIENSQISNAKSNCLKITGGFTDIIHCTIAQFYAWDECGKAISFSNYQDKTYFPLDAMNLTNCLVSGRSDDEVSGSKTKNDSISFEYMFRNCLLQIDTTGMDSARLKDCVFDTDTATSKSKNFKNVKKEDYSSDFSLDSLSKARGIALYISDKYQQDLKGKARPKDGSDAGCYQY